jgi:ATP adenylyltransferase
MSGGDARSDRGSGTLLERLWATWRMKYIATLATDEGPAEDVFVELPRGEDGPGNLIVHRGEHCYVVLNLYPYNNGHAMVIPFRKVAEFSEMTDAEMLEMMRLADLLMRALRRCMRPQGFNLGMNLGRVGGAGIPDHLHLHVVPRWSGDTNFMPVVGQTKVLPEGLEATWRKVSGAIREVLAEEREEDR